jgi:hypothetical protein
MKVPIYQQNVSSRPAYQQDITVRASAEHFGAAVGRGMESFARGVGQAGRAIAEVKELEDIARAKEADNEFAGWLRERMYGEGGFMTLEGRNAVDGRASFEQEVEQKRKSFGSNLKAGAARAYQTASTSRINSTLQQSIVHTAGQRKAWFKDASNARIETFANDALVNYNDPQQLKKNMAAGVMELREKAALEGWDSDTLNLRASQYVSGVHKNVALRIAQDDPLAADKYIKQNSDHISGPDQYALNKALSTEIKNEQSKQEAEAIISAGRSDHSHVESGGSQSIGSRGPTKARAFLQSKSNKPASHVDGLEESFATNLASLIADAPADIREGLGIYSGYRSPDHQKRLWDNALAKYGSPEAARKWVAPPGRSYHNKGEAVDLSYNGQSLRHAPKKVRDWVHANAGKYNLWFPMNHEPWHIEPKGTRGSEPADGTIAPRNNLVASRSLAPSYDEIETRLSQISDPDVRDLTRKRINSMLEARSKAEKAQQDAAKAELWRYVDQGATPDDVPMEVRQAAGMSAVSSAWNYLETAASGREVQSDDVLLYDMRRAAAINPDFFADIDLNEYRDRLSKEAIKELTGLQTNALTDQRKAREDGMTLTTAFSQASSQLEAVGITTTGKDGSSREDAARRIARFNNALASEMQAFKEANEGKNPTQVDIQSMVNRLLLPVVITEPGTFWDSQWRPDGVSGDTFLFDAGNRPDATSVDIGVEYNDIPIDLRRSISRDLEQELGRKPSEEEIVSRYEDFALAQ